jgi:hypothetical protein
MTSQNQAEKDAKTVTASPEDTAPKAALPSEVKRELTDDEIAAVAGGLNPQPLPPIKFI